MAVLIVVEDEPLILWTLVDALEEAGFEVREAETGGEALELLRETTALRLLVTDVDLGPGPSGLEVAHAAQQMWPGLPVLIVSGRDPPAKQDRCWQAWVTKPFDTGQVTTMAERLTRAKPR